ncbi:type II toxin-antitoxin system prevent-host-death family antitoxin [Cyanobacterium aponinum FACHB-4101]|uniref:type II toxin-antitoxin system Phd/YefM family antitoxin n=1 Tax=Cyanobacterium aponinum TaxID=379064 RepID=UPI00168007B0|nr:type II toxin-antitoxin system prevent-host-death family antitoxin [Cyanobacterium aponinum]MBD2392980.1 type II toxin-antitoxin system prevent-host-death family antitoxin [Cyanobacterium aponinum FACHB-4101]
MQITKTEFKAQLEELLNRIQTENEEVIIIDNGKPIFKVMKYQSESVSTAELFASIRGKVKYYEDLTSPTTEEWGEV